MRVAVFSSHTPSLFWFRVDMMETFISRGHTVFAVGNEPEEEWRDRFAEHGIEYRQISVARNGLNPIQDFKTIFSIRKMLSEIHPDKVFLYQAKPVIYGSIVARKIKGVDCYPLIAGAGSAFLSNTRKAKIIRKFLVAEYRYAFKKVRTVFFQNRDDEQLFRENGILTTQKVVLLRGSGVNLERFSVAPLPETPTFLCIGRLIRDKGIYEYLEACKRVKEKIPSVRCMLVGPIDTNPSALKPSDLQPYLDGGAVEYFGEQADVVPFLRQCSIYVLPSYREGTPKTILEAMSCGRAIITTDAPGCRETVSDGQNGYLVPIKDVDALCARMEKLAVSPKQVEEMGRIGRKMAEEIFDVHKVNQTICDTMGL